MKQRNAVDEVANKPAWSEVGISDHISQLSSPDDVVVAVFDTSKCELHPNST
jgi:hypothetical protein